MALQRERTNKPNLPNNFLVEQDDGSKIQATLEDRLVGKADRVKVRYADNRTEEVGLDQIYAVGSVKSYKKQIFNNARAARQGQRRNRKTRKARKDSKKTRSNRR